MQMMLISPSFPSNQLTWFSSALLCEQHQQVAGPLKLGGVGALVMLTGARYRVEALSNQPSELNPVPSRPSHSTRPLQVGSFGSSYNLCYVNGRDVYFYKEKAQI